jgi:hypothetical protein
MPGPDSGGSNETQGRRDAGSLDPSWAWIPSLSWPPAPDHCAFSAVPVGHANGRPARPVHKAAINQRAKAHSPPEKFTSRAKAIWLSANGPPKRGHQSRVRHTSGKELGDLAGPKGEIVLRYRDLRSKPNNLVYLT